MTPGSTTVALGLGAAAIWGAADFCGGLGAKHLRVFWLLAISHGFSLTALLLLIRLTHAQPPGSRILFFGLCSGLCGGLALLTFYHALSLGNMGITAAISGLLTGALPVIFSLATIGSPSPHQLAGFFLAAIAIWLITSQPATDKSELRLAQRRMLLAILSGFGFGAFLIFLRLANGGGLLWPLAASRIGSLAMALGGGLIVSRGSFPSGDGTSSASTGQASRWKTGVLLAVLAGTCDTSGNFLFVAATRIGRLDIAAVLASLYPASTILLAAWVLKERTSLRQIAGMITAMVAVGLIS